MKFKSLAIIALGLVSSTVAFSQEAKVDSLNMLDQRVTTVEDGLFQLKKLKLSGYIQAQWQSSQLDSLGKKTNDMKVGIGKNGAETLPGTTDYNRYGVRRGRLKATYEDFGCQAVIEFDISEGGLKTKDLYLNILDPWVNTFALKGGVFDRPFGYEIAYSSSKLESPERSRLIQTLFPDEKDLGSMLTIQAPKTSPWNVLKLEAGLLSGNSINKDYKSKKDFAAHLTYNKALATMKYGVGVSMYSGSVLQTTANVYSIKNGAFVVDNATSNLNSFADRSYFGVDGQLSIASDLGMSSIRAEYITGTQPGASGSSSSPNGFDPTASGFVAFDTYIRKFSGGYINFVQDIADTKHSIVVKYDWYDPNTNIAGNTVGVAAKTGLADMAYSTLGLGYMYRMNNNVRIMAYYDIVSNESTKVKGYFSNVKDNLVTVRLQYKF
jgi:phosphate-selective porin